MSGRWSLKGQNRGASLLAVLIALVFVTAIAAIVMQTTITNIQMKEVEQSGRENFYSAEEVMDDLTTKLNDKASGAMQDAYNEILSNYRMILLNGEDVQAKFQKLYLDNLKAAFWDGSATNDTTDAGEIVYTEGKYEQQKVKDLMVAAESGYYVMDASGTQNFTADYKEGLFTLEKVKIDYLDAQGYETTITTDMVFHTPNLNFSGSVKVKDYMKYVLIGNVKVAFDYSTNVKVDGSIYAGADGMEFTGSTVSITGNNIVTRGDIVVKPGSAVTIGQNISAAGLGESTTRIWAENIETKGKGTVSASSLVLNGNIYVSDDLVLNAQNSTVTLGGNYYGYNFQKDYAGAYETVTDASFSSAIMINAKNSKLDMSHLGYLMVSGKTYISRGSKDNTQNSDIALGESIAVRTNQLAYNVPRKYLDVPENIDDPVVFTSTGAAEYSDYIGVPNIMDYLNTAKPVNVYWYRDAGVAARQYYLNFASEQKANDFFYAYYNANKSRVDSIAAGYAGEDAIILNDSTLYTLKGDIMYQSAPGANSNEKKVTIETTDWEPAAAQNGVYWDYADRLAIMYKSLQTYLEDNNTAVTSDKVRFMNGTAVDKTQEPLIDNLIKVSEIATALPQTGGTLPSKKLVKEINASSKEVVVVVNNKGKDPYEPEEDSWTQGIIIATGDVKLTRNFTGMIIAGGTITVGSGVTLTSDELLVARLFEEDMAREDADKIFVQYFDDYGTLSDSVIGLVEVDKYLTYENWKKNEE